MKAVIMLDSESILNFLSSQYEDGSPLLPTCGYSMVYQFANHESAFIRAATAKCLVWDTGADARQILCDLAEDEDSLVRVEAVDSLYGYCGQDSLSVLHKALRDTDELVRAYAATSFAHISMELGQAVSLASKTLNDCLQCEGNNLVRVGLLEGLYILGDKDALDGLIDAFDCNDYHVQCFVLHALMEILSTQNQSIIGNFLEGLQESEYPIAVADTIACLRRKIERL